jgi:Trk K+ transport system NAD-binding subunit
VLIIGATRVARAVASALNEHGVTAVVWTASEKRAAKAKSEGLTVYAGDPSHAVSSEPPAELDGIENAMVMTDDDGLNAMMAADLGEYFGRHRVYQLATARDDDDGFFLRARVLFDRSATDEELAGRLKEGNRIEVVESEPGDPGGLPDGAIAMFVLEAGEELRILTAGDRPELEPGDQVIGLARS